MVVTLAPSVDTPVTDKADKAVLPPTEPPNMTLPVLSSVKANPPLTVDKVNSPTFLIVVSALNPIAPDKVTAELALLVNAPELATPVPASTQVLAALKPATSKAAPLETVTAPVPKPRT